MVEKCLNLNFIDRVNYENLQGKNFSNEDIAKICYQDLPNISTLTRAFIIYLNSELSKLLYLSGKKDKQLDLPIGLNTKEYKYIEDSFKIKFCAAKDSRDSIDKKYYEIIILPNNTILIVVEEGFLAFIIESRENFLQFILECFKYQYEFNLSSPLFRTYIYAKMNDGYFNLVKSLF